MFDIGGWELLVAGLVALIVVGPKELPQLLRVVGKYAGMVKRQAGEFRAQFDDAMRDTEIENIRNDLNQAKDSVVSSVHDANESINKDLQDGIDWDDDAEVSTNESNKPKIGEGHVDAGDDDDPGQVADDDVSDPQGATSGANDDVGASGMTASDVSDAGETTVVNGRDVDDARAANKSGDGENSLKPTEAVQ